MQRSNTGDEVTNDWMKDKDRDQSHEEDEERDCGFENQGSGRGVAEESDDKM